MWSETGSERSVFDSQTAVPVKWHMRVGSARRSHLGQAAITGRGIQKGPSPHCVPLVTQSFPIRRTILLGLPY
jgi:hypothetical protein